MAVTAVAFMLWYTCVQSIGAGRAGLLTGVAPIAAAVVGILIGGRPPQLLVWLGIAVVAAGLVIGMIGRDRSEMVPSADASSDCSARC